MAEAKRGESQRTTFLVSMTEADKDFLKLYALENKTTVAALIHAYVETLREKRHNDSNTEKEGEGTGNNYLAKQKYYAGSRA